MATYKTPGVFIEEISTLGSSIAGVPTAIPGFVGYTEKAIIDGTPWTYPSGAPAPPVRITSLLEYQQIFGGPFNEKFTVTLTGTVPTPTTVAVAPATSISNYILFYQIQMFYANGGGTCYITSAGKYSVTANIPDAIDPAALINAINLFEQIDEVTLLVSPEAVFLPSTNLNKIRQTVYNRMTLQCAKMQDRFAVLDTVHNANNTIFQDATDFRNNDISADNLKYAATYYPALSTPLIYFYNNSETIIKDNRPTLGAGPYNTAPNNTLAVILNGTYSSASITVSATPVDTTDTFTINPGTAVIMVPKTLPTPGVPEEFAIGTDKFDSTNNLVNAINAHPVLSGFVTAVKTSTVTIAKFSLTAKQQGTIGNYPYSGVSKYGAAGNLSGGIASDKLLYNNITAELSKYTLTLYPSAAMAGTYARVDADRGVWKAPANVGLTLVNVPTIQITDDDQENLNVDSVSGKSINAIRMFTGRGTLVWGARTLAGNDNEWRYINVRRLFIYVEESIKKATEFVVFESNTANTWQRVTAMCEAFLTGLWRDGALAGATPKDAFFVRVGLGTTMTAQDILEGKMIVEIGMAAARPAEFIILRFSHKLQES
jgi:phage tail sheath protein FI